MARDAGRTLQRPPAVARTSIAPPSTASSSSSFSRTSSSSRSPPSSPAAAAAPGAYRPPSPLYRNAAAAAGADCCRSSKKLRAGKGAAAGSKLCWVLTGGAPHCGVPTACAPLRKAAPPCSVGAYSWGCSGAEQRALPPQESKACACWSPRLATSGQSSQQAVSLGTACCPSLFLALRPT